MGSPTVGRARVDQFVPPAQKSGFRQKIDVVDYLFFCHLKVEAGIFVVG